MTTKLKELNICKAGEADREIIKSMLQPYLAEIGAGPEYIYFDSYWTSDKRIPYIFRLQNEVVGFCFVRLLKEENSFELAEFYITPEHRCNRLGTHAAHAVFSKHPGLWILSVLPQNRRVYQFWQSVVCDLTNEPPQIELEDSGHHILRFNVNNINEL